MQLRRNLVRRRIKKNIDIDSTAAGVKERVRNKETTSKSRQSSSTTNSEAKKKNIKNRVIRKKKGDEDRGRLSKTNQNKNVSQNIFEGRENLIDFLNNEKSFKIQIFSLESVEIFEILLKMNGIAYKKDFTTTFKNSCMIQLLVDDGRLKEQHSNQKIILYSNNRNFGFIPYKFKLSINEKNRICEDLLQIDGSSETKTLNKNNEKLSPVRDRIKKQRGKSGSTGEVLQFGRMDLDINSIALNPKSSLTSMLLGKPDVYDFAKNSLNYIQCVIVMGMIRENKFIKIFNEVKSIDPTLDNKFLIKCELNSLINKKICSKNGESYKLAISNLTVQNICKHIGFGNMLF